MTTTQTTKKVTKSKDEVIRLQDRVREVAAWNMDRMVHSSKAHTVEGIRKLTEEALKPIQEWEENIQIVDRHILILKLLQLAKEHGFGL